MGYSCGTLTTRRRVESGRHALSATRVMGAESLNWPRFQRYTPPANSLSRQTIDVVPQAADVTGSRYKGHCHGYNGHCQLSLPLHESALRGSTATHQQPKLEPLGQTDSYWGWFKANIRLLSSSLLLLGLACTGTIKKRLLFGQSPMWWSFEFA